VLSVLWPCVLADDMEGWDGMEGNTSGYAKECGGAEAFHAAAKQYFTVTISTVKSLRPKAKFGFYGRPVQEAGGRSYDCECGSDCTTCASPDYRYANDLRAANDGPPPAFSHTAHLALSEFNHCAADCAFYMVHSADVVLRSG